MSRANVLPTSALSMPLNSRRKTTSPSRLAISPPSSMVQFGTRPAMSARTSIVASGTATVEAALIGNPFVVVYRVSPLTFAIARRLVKVPHVAMANLIAGKRVVPELIQHDFTAANIVQHLRPLLPDGPARESMMRELAEVREKLALRRGDGDDTTGGAIERVAAITWSEIAAAQAAEARQ